MKMEEMDEFLAAVDKLDLGDEIKDALKKPVSAMNKELGVRGSDLKTLRTELTNTKEKVVSYKDFAELAAKKNLKAEDIEKLAEQAGIQKTQDDKLSEYKNVLSETQNENKTLKDELLNFKKTMKYGPMFEDAAKSFKDGENKTVELLKTFVDNAREEVLKTIKDDDDEILINDRFNKALQKAKIEQENFLKENGLQRGNNKTHVVVEQNLAGSGSGKALTSGEELRKVLVEGRGSVDSAAQVIARLRKARENNQ